MEHLVLRESPNPHQLNELQRQNDFRAVVISAKSLSRINKETLFESIETRRHGSMPLLVLGISSGLDSGLLNSWSGGSVLGSKSLAGDSFKGTYKISNSKEMTRQLSGLEIPFKRRQIDYYTLDSTSVLESIIRVANSSDEEAYPIFVKTTIDGQDVFFGILSKASDSIVESSHQFSMEEFLEIAPLMMFLRYVFGDRCWHSPGYYANLTVDDAWLTEPYGHLSYRVLFEQMEKTNFHTTIAFIPWNYDRSEPEIVSLFRNHPDRFSISIHGNNHDHYEFYEYETATGDPRVAKPLIDQEADIVQAMARMKEHSALTELPYDPIMVFPQAIAPAKTLGLLKKYNFIATTNEVNVPLSSKVPIDPLFDLRPVSLSFENFASLRRFSPKDRSRFSIAVDLFLGNPLLFFEHHDFFAEGIDAFNETAELINVIEPNTKWQGLGTIARHLYLQRLRSDGNYDIRAYSCSIELENQHERSVTYFIRKEESFVPPIAKLTVNGQSHPYQQEGKDLCLSITIPANQSRQMNIIYENDLDLASIEIVKSDPHINRLRKLSDFRDRTLSQNMFGRLFKKIYYGYSIYKLGLEKVMVLGFLLGSLSVFCGWYLLRRRLVARRRYRTL